MWMRRWLGSKIHGVILLTLRHFYALRARAGQHALCATRFRMRVTEDPPSPLDHVLQDGLCFERVVACIEIKNGCAADRR